MDTRAQSFAGRAGHDPAFLALDIMTQARLPAHLVNLLQQSQLTDATLLDLDYALPPSSVLLVLRRCPGR